jgi:NADP-dependent 3-hydroxy acid dehydrogenase YdfG/acyl carrier protein
VLNSLTGDAVTASLGLLREGGRFLEIGKNDVRGRDDIARAYPDIAYHVLDLGELIVSDPSRVRAALEATLAAATRGEITPLPRHRFALEDAVSAFRFMARARHIGKVVLGPGPSFRGRTKVRPDRTYLVTGGNGALGQHIIQELCAQGARQIVVVSRHAPEGTATASPYGATVAWMQADVADRSQLEAVLQTIDGSMPPLGGIVHAAGVLSDGLVSSQTRESLLRVLRPKAIGALHLHELTRNRPLDFFVLFSSLAALTGSAGQSNYTAANAFLDALALGRQAQGLPGTSLNWGAWSGGGMAQGVDTSHQDRWRARGIAPVEPQAGREAFTFALQSGLGQCAVTAADWSRASADVPPLFAELARSVQHTASPATSQIRIASPDDLAGFVRARVSELLQIPSDRLPPMTPLIGMGFDSLMAVELRNACETALGIRMSMAELLDGATVATVVERLASGAGAMVSAGAPQQPAYEEGEL